MSWQKTLLDASFKGVRFDCEDIQEDAQRDIQRHAYPYVNGEDTEDLGRNAIDSQVTAVFWGEDYEQRLQKFLAVLEQPGPGELIHPILGSIPLAQLQGWRLGHRADSPDACTVELRFIHSTPSSPLFVRQLPEQKAAASRQYKDDGLASGIESFAARIKALTSLEGAAGRLNSIRATTARVLGALRSVTGGVGTVSDMVEFPRAFTSELSEGLRGLVDLRSFDQASRMSDWKGMKGVFDDVIRLPVASAKGEIPTSFRPAQANPSNGHASQPPISILAEDQQPIAAVVKVAAAAELVTTASDILTMEAKAPTLTPADIEVIACDVRQAIQGAIDAHRQLYPVEQSRGVTEPLKDAALAIQEAARAVIETRPPLLKRIVAAQTNLHLLAHEWYGDYRRAGELARLNPLVRNPNDIAPGTALNSYAR